MGSKLQKNDVFWVKNHSSDLQQVLNRPWLITNIAYGLTFKLGPQATTRGSLTGLQGPGNRVKIAEKWRFLGKKSFLWPPAISESPLVDHKYCIRLDLQVSAPSDDMGKPSRPKTGLEMGSKLQKNDNFWGKINPITSSKFWIAPGWS